MALSLKPSKAHSCNSYVTKDTYLHLSWPLYLASSLSIIHTLFSNHVKLTLESFVCVWLIFFSFQRFYFLCIYLWLCWGLCCTHAFSRCGEWELLSRCGARDSCCSGSVLLQSPAPRCTDFNSCGSRALDCLRSSCGSVVVVHGLTCPTACGIFSDQGLNPCPCIGGRFSTTESPEEPSGHFSRCLKYPSLASSAD